MQSGLWDAPPAPPKKATVELRPYQIEAVRRIYEELETNRSTLLVMATGTGKTSVFCDVISTWPRRCLVIAHREELIAQAAQRIEHQTGLPIEIEKASQVAAPLGSATVIASIQTLSQERRLNRWPSDSFGLVIVDEAHHAVADSYRKVLEYFGPAKVLGVTATPDRGDRLAMGAMFDSVSHVYDIQDAIKDKWLCPIRSTIVQVDTIKLETVKTVAGDLNQGQLDAVMATEENLHGIAKPTLELAGDRRTIVFTTSVDNATRLAEIFNRYRSNSAMSIDGGTEKEERRRRLSGHKDGSFQFLCNVGVLTEGYDDPAIACIAMGRPTKSRALFAQMAGRGTRIHPGKTDLHILDFVGNSGNHKLVTAQDILAGKYPDEVVEKAKELTMAEPGLDVNEALQRSEEALRLAREAAARDAARRAAAKGKVGYSTREINPFAVLDIADPDERYAGQFGSKPASEKQIAYLSKMGISAEKGTLPRNCTSAQAQALIKNSLGRRQHGLCTFSQMRVLQRAGCDAKNIGFAQASALIDALAKNNWKPLPLHQAQIILGKQRQRDPGEEG